MTVEKTITEQALREKFESYKEIFQGSDSAKQFDAANDMLMSISSYLGNYVGSIDIWPMTKLLAEFASIEKGGEPQFLKSKNKTPGRPIDPAHNITQASLVAAVEILHRHGFRVNEAIKYVSERSWLSAQQLQQLRKDYSRGKKWIESSAWTFEQSQLKFPSQQDAESYVESLLVMANQTRKAK